MSSQISAPFEIVALVGSSRPSRWARGRSRGQRRARRRLRRRARGRPVAQHPVAAAKSVATKLSAHNKAATGAQAGPTPSRRRRPKPVTHPAPTAEAGSVKAPDGSADDDRLRAPLASRRRRPARTTRSRRSTSSRSARRGAARSRSHAGFLLVNVLSERQVLPFARTYGVLQAPTVLFFARPGKLVQKLTGYADSETVAQAALNAARGLVVPRDEPRGDRPRRRHPLHPRRTAAPSPSSAPSTTAPRASSRPRSSRSWAAPPGGPARTRSRTRARPPRSSPKPSRR